MFDRFTTRSENQLASRPRIRSPHQSWAQNECAKKISRIIGKRTIRLSDRKTILKGDVHVDEGHQWLADMEDNT